MQTSSAAGAAFVSRTGHGLAAHFAGVEAEWAAVRRRCGLLDAGFRALLRMTGSDRLTFLQGMVSNDVAALREGQGVYAALLTQQGKVVSDLRVYALADEVWLDVPAHRGPAVREALERYIVADDAEFSDSEDWVPLTSVEGPLAAEVVAKVLGNSVADLQRFAHRAATIDGAAVRVVGATHTGEPGYLLCGAPDLGAALWARLRAAGAEPVGLEALDVLRIEAGIPWHGRDMDETTLIGEVGLEAAISYRKGCYLGQEIVERVSARGQVHRKLVGLLCAGRALPHAGAAVRHQANDIGRVTSAAWSPGRGVVVALGYVRRECWEDGTAVDVQLADGVTGAVVRTLPFHRHGSAAAGGKS